MPSKDIAWGMNPAVTISGLISAMSQSWSKREAAQIKAMVLDSVFGMFVSGAPQAEPGTSFTADGSGSMKMSFVVDPKGRKMIKACADPELFSRNYPGSVNVTINGKELITMAEKIPDAAGILICSATSFNSYPIYRDTYAELRTPPAAASAGRKWWEFWKG